MTAGWLGLGREELLADGSVETTLICTAEHAGCPRVAHGGWTAAMFDEVTGHVPLLNGQLSVTGTMRVAYVKPVPIERPRRGRAWATNKDEKRWYIEGELTLAATGALLGRAEAVMVLRDPVHFERHRSWLAEQSASPVPCVTRHVHQRILTAHKTMSEQPKGQ